MLRLLYTVILVNIVSHPNITPPPTITSYPSFGSPTQQQRTFGVQHARYVQVLLGHVECGVQVLQRIVLGELMVIDEVGPVSVYKGAEGQTVFETETKTGWLKRVLRDSRTTAHDRPRSGVIHVTRKSKHSLFLF